MKDQSKTVERSRRQAKNIQHAHDWKKKQNDQPTTLCPGVRGGQEPSLLRAEVLTLPENMGSQSEPPKSWLLHSFSVRPSARHLTLSEPRFCHFQWVW